jgi:hypothetical protein
MRAITLRRSGPNRRRRSGGSVSESAESRRLARHRRYNSSRKGQARNMRYEARHPERKLRWPPVTGRDVAAGNLPATGRRSEKVLRPAGDPLADAEPAG